MPKYTAHYSNSAGGPPIGEVLTVEASDINAAIDFAEANCPPISHQPSIGDIRGYCLCDENGMKVREWQEARR